MGAPLSPRVFPPPPVATRSVAWIRSLAERGAVPGGYLTMLLAAAVGLLAGFGAAIFGHLIEGVTELTYGLAAHARGEASGVLMALWTVALIASPAIGLLVVSWATRTFAPEAQGHGVPEVITAVARHDGVIRPRIALVKILASGVTIGTGGCCVGIVEEVDWLVEDSSVFIVINMRLRVSGL